MYMCQNKVAVLLLGGTVLVGAFTAAASEQLASRGGPVLLFERPLPPIKENPDFPRETAANDAVAEREPFEQVEKKETNRRYAPFRDHRRFPERNGAPPRNAEPAAEEEVPAAVTPDHAAGATDHDPTPSEVTNYDHDPDYGPGIQAAAAAEAAPLPPTPESIEAYRRKLEERLLERYNNLPASAGKVAKVSVVATKPLEVSLDGSLIRAEFDQLVYDVWGKRMPALEKEYFVVTFGTGGVAQVRSDPSIRVGLDLEKTYSERTPLAADPFRHVEDYDAFADEPKAAMPGWWRPEYPELR